MEALPFLAEGPPGCNLKGGFAVTRRLTENVPRIQQGAAGLASA